jgi:REP element-mobilizing transposase RayT
VTICTGNRRPFFGQVRNGIIGLSAAGCIAAREWQRTPVVRPSVRLDAWIVTPDHIHDLIGIMT